MCAAPVAGGNRCEPPSVPSPNYLREEGLPLARGSTPPTDEEQPLAFPTFRARTRLDPAVPGAPTSGAAVGVADRPYERPEIELELDVSVVIPCLDEEETIAVCVRDARAAIDRRGLRGEVLVVDNGSRDSSPELAAEAGAIVVHEDRRGYGRAYLTGLERARGRFILLGDGDATYDFDELPWFLDAMDDGADMVL